jgi:hypothetical protein
MRKNLLLLGGILILACCFSSTSEAQVPKNKGLLLSPLREYARVDAGTQKEYKFRVSNLTEQPMEIAFHVQNFSVTDYAYDYAFKPPENEWVKLSETATTLQPAQQKDIHYTVAVPSDAAPGGHYYTLFASQSKNKGSVEQQIQVGSLVYLTVNGTAQQSSNIKRIDAPSFTTSRHITIAQDIQNTGNVHFFVQTYNKLSGAFGLKKRTDSSHILMPQTIRRIDTELLLPALPGIYTLHSGYTTELASPVNKKQFIVYMPLWSFVVLPLIVALPIVLFRKKRNITQQTTDSPPQ